MNDFFKNDYMKAFQDFSKNYQGFNPFQNMGQGFGQNAGAGFPSFPQFQAPQLDANKFFTLQRKNIEAFASAAKAVNEGAQAIARRGAEFLRDNMEDALSASREVVSTGSAPDKALAKQADYAKTVLRNSAEQLREMSEMASRTQFEAFDILSSRVSRSVEEVKDFSSKATGKKAA